MIDWVGFWVQWTPGYSGITPGARGRLVIHYPILLTVLLILAILVVVAVGAVLTYWIKNRWGTLERRVTETEQALQALSRKQQTELDAFRRHLKPPAEIPALSTESPPEPEQDTMVGRRIPITEHVKKASDNG